MGDLDRLIRDLGHPGLPWELLTLAICLGLAWVGSWLVGRRHGADSVWFGRALVDGLLFPMLALLFTVTASHQLVQYQKVVLLKQVVLPILVSFAGIRFIARVLTVVFPRSGLARLVERLFSWVAWLAAVLWIIGVLPVMLDELDAINFVFGKSKVSLLTMAQGFLTAAVVLVLSLWLSAVLERRVLREAVNDLSLRKVAANTVRATLLVIGLLIALSAVGVDLTALSVLGGALGVGLGFGLQKLAANYVSGFVILFERSLRIGDTVRVDGFEGAVVDIKTRYTLIRALDGRDSIVPNEKLITERVENLSLADPKLLLIVDVCVGYDSDVERVQRLLVEAAAGCPRVLRDPAPGARLARLGSDGLEFKLLFWISDPANGQLNVRSDVNIAVLKALQAASIELPYPQRVVHLRGGTA